MRRIPLWAMTALLLPLLLALTACQQETPEEPPASPTVTEPSALPDPSLAALREEMADAPWAVACLGYLNEDESLGTLLAQEDLPPFLAEIDQIVQIEGNEVYCLVPQTGGSLTIQEIQLDENDTFQPQKTLYEGGDQPVLLVCNISDIIPNTLATFTAADGSVSTFSPSLSLCDGSVALPADVNAYDFTPAPVVYSPDDVFFLGDWRTTVDQVELFLSFRADGTMLYTVDDLSTKQLDRYEGTYYIVGENTEYPTGAVVFELLEASTDDPLWGVYVVNQQQGTLTVTHANGTPLLDDLAGGTIELTPN